MARPAPLERVLLAIARGFASLTVRPTVLPEDLTERIGASGREICYVVERFSVIDSVVLEQACLNHAWPSPDGELAGTTRVIFLERRAGFFGNRVDRRVPAGLRTILDAAHERPAFDVDFIPVGLYWGRAPDRERSWFRLMLAESWDLASRFRRFVSLIVNGRNLLVQFGDAIELRPLLDDTGDGSRAVRRVARVLRTALRNQHAATIGPDLSHRRTIVAQVLRTRAVRNAVRDEMRARGLSRRQALLEAKRYADEIAANYSHSFVSLISRVLARLWNRLYDGVELHHVENLQAVADGREIIYVPCHRSHMDYLLLSYVIYHHGFAVPHIAAGINLNMPAVGPFLRRGGAFFIRRSFRGNTLYTMVFMRYFGLMMARGHAIEYFIEGGRSRTGRLLEPRTGMLSMTVRSFLRDPRRPLVFVPVYFGYERLVEGATYVGELSGKPKQRESVFGMLRSLPALRSRFGKVRVNIGEPIELAGVLAARAPEWDGRPVELDERPRWLAPVIDDLAHEIMVRINSAACATPVNMLALALLATPRQSMLEADLTRQLELYASLMRQAPYSPWVVVTDLDGASMVRYGESMGVIVRRPHALGDVIQMTPEASVLMAYFRNNVLHLVAMTSLIACCFLNNRSMRTEDIQRLAWRIYPYIGDELFLRWREEEIPDVVREILDHLANHGLIDAIDAGTAWRRPPTGSAEAVQLSNLAQLTVQVLERYYLAISILLRAGSGRISQAALESQCQLTAQRMSMLYELDSPEYFDRSLFKNFIDLLRARNVLGVNAEGKLTYTEMLIAVSEDAQLVLHEQIRNSVLQVTHR
jgi:glycerol-3-phosphate O-acyltransferase